MRIILAFAFLIFLSGCIRIPTNKSQLKFPKREVSPSSNPYKLHYHSSPLLRDYSFKLPKLDSLNLDQLCEKSNTSSLIIAKADTILYKWHNPNLNSDTILSSFSLAKSFLSSLVGIAIAEGKINSVEDPVHLYLPDLNVHKDTLRIRHLLQMRSGYRMRELKIFFSNNHQKTISQLKPFHAPDEKFVYWSVVSQILGQLLSKAIYPQTLSSYLEEKIWIPAGMKGKLNWRLDSEDGTEKAFCCMEVLPEDLIRYGNIILNDGYWNGSQIIPKDWLQEVSSPFILDGENSNYGYHFWLPRKNNKVLLARGYRGQYLVINKETGYIMVRMGTSRKKMGFYGWDIFLISLSENLP